VAATEIVPVLPILRVRGHAVMLDHDLAKVYGVPTSRLNEAVKRNAGRFPNDFLFQLAHQEVASLISQIAISKKGRGGTRKLPWAFTEHGAIMAATVLKSERAVAMSLYVVRAFVRLRGELLANVSLEMRLQKIEKTLMSHDSALRDLYEKLKPLLLPPPESEKREMGYHTHLKHP
jgi:hypothetical protein